MQRTVRWLCTTMSAMIFVTTQAIADPDELVQKARITQVTIEKQRLLRSALAENPQHSEALILLGESQYYETGDIRGAVENFNKVIALGQDENGYASGYLEEIGILFKPLQIKLIDRRVSALGYIDVAYRIRAPRSLQDHQKIRLKYLEEHASEFQINTIDKEGRPVFKLAFFPVVMNPGDQYSNYAIVVGNKRRYRFDFTQDVQDPVEIRWEEEWTLIERVPAGLVKVEHPMIYTIEPDRDVMHFALDDSLRKIEGRYIAADANVQLVLRDSEQKDKERHYNLAVKIVMGVAALIGLIGTR